MALWCEELSPAARAGLLADLDWLNPKNGRVYLRLMLYIARFGSAPDDDRLAEHLGVSKQYWKKRAWPSLEDMFEIRGNRIYHPEIGGAPDVRRKAAAQVAAQARWGSKPQVIFGAGEGAHGSVTASESHAESHGNSMRGASEAHAVFDANACSDASPDAFGASDASRAPSPFLASSASFQPTVQTKESKEESESGGVDARASADAPAHASGMPSDAITACVTGSESHAITHPGNASESHANGHAITHPVTASPSHANGYTKPDVNGCAEPPVLQTRSSVKAPITDDWQPTAEAVREIDERGCDPALVAEKYRAWCRDGDRWSADHDAGFRLFYLKEHPPHRQNHTTKPAKGAFIMSEVAEMARSRGYLPPDDDGTILEGVAS